MRNHLLNLSASNGEVGSGVKYLGLIVHNAADTCGHSETDIGVDIDLADSHGSSLAELLLGDTYSVGKLAAESVDLSNVLLRNGRSAVENDGESGESLLDFFENVEAERRGERGYPFRFWCTA